MALRTARIRLTRAAAPFEYPDLGVRFEREMVAGVNNQGSTEFLLMKPASSLLPPQYSTGPDKSFYHVLGGLILRSGDGRGADGEPGQLLRTSRRVVGMIEAGNSESGVLGLDSVGHIYCFSIGRRDIVGPQIKKRFMKASDFSFQASGWSGMSFSLQMYAAMACVLNGKADYWHDRDMIRAFSAETLADDLRQ